MDPTYSLRMKNQCMKSHKSNETSATRDMKRQLIPQLCPRMVIHLPPVKACPLPQQWASHLLCHQEGRELHRMRPVGVLLPACSMRNSRKMDWNLNSRTLLLLRERNSLTVNQKNHQMTFLRSLQVCIIYRNIAPFKALFQPKNSDIFLISPWKHMLWVLIRSTSPRCF